MRSRDRPSLWLPAALLSAIPGASAQAPAPPIATYEARYQVEYKGRKVGISQFSVTYDGARERYVFRSETTATGLLKLLAPGPVVEQSELILTNGEIRPLEFRYEDGTRKGEDSFTLRFQWEKGVAVSSGADWKRELELRPGVLDRGSMQVAVMRDMASAEGPNAYLLADEDSLKRYEYAPQGASTITTPLGTFDTEVYVQTREGSDNVTTLWAAPRLDFLPVQVERHRDGELQTALILESVQGLDAAP